MRYLLDEFVRYENGYGDMLSPCRDDSRHSIFMGSSEGDPVTKQSIALLQKSLRNEADERNAALRKEISNEISNLGLSVSQQIEGVLHAMASSSCLVPQVPPQASLRVDPQAPSRAVAQIALEYELLNMSDDNMKDVHGAALGKMFATLVSIRKHKRLRQTGLPMHSAQEVADDDEEGDEEEEDDDEQEDKEEEEEDEEEEEEDEPPLIRRGRKI
ncbi:hypothetical protein BGZ75_006579 [Mortierella antarctica]|nr:hypothetical protein BGZ75_006579 [Mortierella antarctica]